MNYLGLVKKFNKGLKGRIPIFYLYNPLFLVGVVWLVVGLIVAVSTDSCVTA